MIDKTRVAIYTAVLGGCLVFWAVWIAALIDVL